MDDSSGGVDRDDAALVVVAKVQALLCLAIGQARIDSSAVVDTSGIESMVRRLVTEREEARSEHRFEVSSLEGKIEMLQEDLAAAAREDRAEIERLTARLREAEDALKSVSILGHGDIEVLNVGAVKAMNAAADYFTKGGEVF
jgi:hypothetical protein